MRKVERKRTNPEVRKYYLVGSLCITMFLMLGIGYAVLSQQLDINGTAQITSNWKILFTSAEEKEMTNATTTRKEITDLTTLTLDVNLTQPGASATYDVVVENQGDLDAVLSSINGVNENNNKDPKAIKVSIENIKVGDPLLAGDKKTFQVKVYWDASVDFNETNMSKEIEITLTYEQSDDGVPVGPIPGNVGLVNVSDLLRASTNIVCTSITVEQSPSYVCDRNYLIDGLLYNHYYWTINAYSDESEESSQYVWGVSHGTSTGISKWTANNNYPKARPVVFLKSSIQLTGGDGTQSNPFVIG